MKTIDSREVFGNTHLISDEDYEALDLVINNPLRLITKEYNIGEIIQKVGGELSPELKCFTYRMDADAVRARLDELRALDAVGHKEFEAGLEELNRLRSLDQWDHSLGEKCQRLECEMGAIHSSIQLCEYFLSNSVGGKIEVSENIMGEFISSPSPKVVLYYKNIQEASRYTVSGLVPVFVHEMFHAWNYFEADSLGRSVKEIDEAMVEFATIHFLDSLAKSLAKTDSKMASLISRRADWQRHSVRKKQGSVGDLAAYGFGYCLNEKVHDDASLWLETYAAKSASLSLGDRKVKKVVEALVPFYPFDSEDKVFKQFEDIIFAKDKAKCVTVSTRAKIVNALKDVSPSIVAHINANPKAGYKLFAKVIKHSDLYSGGKRTDLKQGNDKNILYYLTVAQMDLMGLDRVAHQSNLSFPKAVCDALSVKGVKGTVINFLLANDSAVYFSPSYSIKIVDTLGKKFPWQPDECTYKPDSGSFTSMHMTYGDHGVGTSNDPEFQALRRNIFVDDVVYFLVETVGTTKNLYVILSKATDFYDVLGMPRPSAKTLADKKVEMTEQEVREQQEAWKELLAQEMKQHASSDTEVFCPLTGIKGAYENLKMLFIASHIKAYADCEEHEKFDVNNGLLLSAGADALFDKYMISISEDKEILFSFLIDDDAELKKTMRLDQEVFKKIFTPERMEYVKVHRQKFFEKEKERMSGRPLATKSSGEILAELCLNLNRDELIGTCLPPATKGAFLVAPYENILHKKWIIRESLFNTLITMEDLKNTSLDSFPETIILYDKYDLTNLVAYGLNDCKYLKGDAMEGCPVEIDNEQSYLVYTLGQKKTVNIDLAALARHVDSKYGDDSTSKLIFINN